MSSRNLDKHKDGPHIASKLGLQQKDLSDVPQLLWNKASPMHHLSLGKVFPIFKKTAFRTSIIWASV